MNKLLVVLLLALFCLGVSASWIYDDAEPPQENEEAGRPALGDDDCSDDEDAPKFADSVLSEDLKININERIKRLLESIKNGDSKRPQVGTAFKSVRPDIKWESFGGDSILEGSKTIANTLLSLLAKPSKFANPLTETVYNRLVNDLGDPLLNSLERHRMIGIAGCFNNVMLDIQFAFDIRLASKVTISRLPYAAKGWDLSVEQTRTYCMLIVNEMLEKGDVKLSDILCALDSIVVQKKKDGSADTEETVAPLYGYIVHICSFLGCPGLDI